MSLPAVDAIATFWPDATIEIFVGQHSRAAFDFRPTITIRPMPDTLGFNGALQLSRILRQRTFDLVINLDRSRWLRLAAHTSRVPKTAGIAPRRPEVRHESDVYLDVVRSFGIPTPFGIPAVAPSASAERCATSYLESVRYPFVVLHPGGAQNPGTAMLNKRWPIDRFTEVARTLQSDGCDIIISGGAGDRELALRLAIDADLPAERVLAGRADIATATAILGRAAAYVGPDTGISHIAAAAGTPTIAIFGPTNPRRYRPLGRDVQILAPPESWQIADHDLRRPQSLSVMVSTERVTLEAVLAATRRVLQQSGGDQQ